MKKLLTVLFVSAIIYSCGDGGNEGATANNGSESSSATADTSTPSAGNGAGGAVEGERGLELIGSSDCTTCHQIDRKIIGPAYIDVAKKYETTPAVIDTLISKIKNGGMGNWGNIPMTPHPDLSDADAREMVTYILSLDNK